LSANRLTYLPGRGDFKMSQLDAPNHPYPLTSNYSNKEQDEETSLLEKAIPSQQESLQAWNDIDLLEGYGRGYEDDAENMVRI
jgi:hypothetical protein